MDVNEPATQTDVDSTTCPFGMCGPDCAPDQDRHVKIGTVRVDPDNLDDPVVLNVIHEGDPDGGPGTYMYEINGHVYSRSMLRQLVSDYFGLEQDLLAHGEPVAVAAPVVPAHRVPGLGS